MCVLFLQVYYSFLLSQGQFSSQQYSQQYSPATPSPGAMNSKLSVHSSGPVTPGARSLGASSPYFGQSRGGSMTSLGEYIFFLQWRIQVFLLEGVPNSGVVYCQNLECQNVKIGNHVPMFCNGKNEERSRVPIKLNYSYNGTRTLVYHEG